MSLSTVTPSVFYRPLNAAITTVTVDYTAGGGSLAVAAGAVFGSGNVNVRITAQRASDGARVHYALTHVAGNVLTVAPIDGFSDINLLVGDQVAQTDSADDTLDLQVPIAAIQVALNLHASTAAPLVSPAFTGTPTAPTAANGTSTTQLATTAFVIANASSSRTWVYASSVLASDATSGPGSVTGSDQHVAINALLALAKTGPLGVVWDVKVATSRTSYYWGDTEIRGVQGGSLSMLSGASANNAVLLANGGVVAPIAGNTNGFFGLVDSGSPTSNLGRLVGGFVDDSIVVDGMYLNGNAANNSGSGNQGGILGSDNATLLVNFRAWGVRKVRFSNNESIDAPCYNVWIANVLDAIVENNLINQKASSFRGANFSRDGVHYNGPGGRFRTVGNVIVSNDDGIAGNFVDGAVTASTLNFPQPGDVELFECLDNTLGIPGTPSDLGIRLLSTYYGCQNVVIRGLRGATTGCIGLIDTFRGLASYPTYTGKLGNVTIDDVAVQVTALIGGQQEYAFGDWYINANIRNLLMRNHVILDPIGNRPYISLQPNQNGSYATIAPSVIGQFYAEGTVNDNTSGAREFVQNKGCSIANGRIKARYLTSQTTSVAVPYRQDTAGGGNATIARLVVEAECDKVPHIVDLVSGGNPSTIVFADGYHTGASVGGSLNVASGMTVLNQLFDQGFAAASVKSGAGTVTHTNSYNEPGAGPTLVSIAVTPGTPAINTSATQQFTATGTYSDSTTANITTSCTWTSGTPGHATIVSGTGLATAVAAGATLITATLGGVNGSTTLTVNAVTLVSIAVTPGTPSVALGLPQQFVATGTYSDASTAVITTSVTWASGTPSHATIGASTGLAATVAVGTTTITATLGVSGSTVMTVAAAALASIAVTPANPTITTGATDQFTATGTYTDATTVNITGSVTWSSLSTGVATITSGGLATGVGPGTSSIHAVLSGITGQTILTDGSNALTAAMVSYWKLGEASGTRADSIGSNALADNGTVGEAAGQVGGAAVFGGTNFLSSTSAGLTPGTGSFFIGARFFPTSFPGSGEIICRRLNIQLNIDYAVRTESGGGITFFTSPDDGSTLSNQNYGGTITANNWHTVLCYYDQPNNLMGLAVDGGNFATITPAQAVGSSGVGDTFTIGACTTGTEGFIGSIDAAFFGTGYVPTNADSVAFWNGGAGHDFV